jgi:hypothetical protein
MRVFTLTGQGTLRVLDNFGAMAIFFSIVFINIFRRKQLREIINQVFLGAGSSLIVMLVGLFTGMVLGLQFFYTLVKFGFVGALGSAVSLSLVREMGPVLTPDPPPKTVPATMLVFWAFGCTPKTVPATMLVFWAFKPPSGGFVLQIHQVSYHPENCVV